MVCGFGRADGGGPWDAEAKRRVAVGWQQSSNVAQRESQPEVLPSQGGAATTAQPLRPNRQRLLPLLPLLRPSAPGVPCWRLGRWPGPGLAGQLLGLGAGSPTVPVDCSGGLAVVAVIGMVDARSPLWRRQPVGRFAFRLPGRWRPTRGSAGASSIALKTSATTHRPVPWERSSMAFDAARPGFGRVIGSGLAGSQNWGIPAGFDAEGFVSAAKRNFVTLQAAWDRSDIATLRSMMTDNMLEEIRASWPNGSPNGR